MLFLNFLSAVLHDMQVTFGALSSDRGVVGFFLGVVVTIIGIAYAIAENPRFFVCAVIYDKVHAFSNVSPRETDGTYKISFTEFSKRHGLVRKSLICAAIIVLCLVLFYFLRPLEGV